MPAEMTMLSDHPARQLLDFSQKLDINLLDNVVNSMYHDIGSQVSICTLAEHKEVLISFTVKQFGKV